MKELDNALRRAETERQTSQDPAPEPGRRTDLDAPRMGGLTGALERAAMSSAAERQNDVFHTTEELPVLDTDLEAFRRHHGEGMSKTSGSTTAYRMLRTQVVNAMADRGARIIGVTSPRTGAGKTTTSIHLALTCARRAEQGVVLCDFDFRRPSVAPYLQATNFRPSIDFFSGDARLRNCLSRSEEGNLLFLLTNRPSDLSAEYLSGTQMDTALDELAGSFDDTIVIADLPPLFGCDDTLGILPKLDAVLLVLAAGETTTQDVEQVAKILPKEKILATVLNKSSGTITPYEYY